MRVDLHIHTIASDGCWPPATVVDEVEKRGIGLFAIADHDTVANVDQTETLARQSGLNFLRAAEISSFLDGDVFHVLAYGYDPDDAMFLAFLAENEARLIGTNVQIIHSLIAAGYALDVDDYLAYEFVRGRGGWKALNFLIDRGFCAGVGEYFKLIAPNVSIDWSVFPHPAEVISRISEAGGMPILAHPGANLYLEAGSSALQPFLDFGVAGLECYSSYHDEAATNFCLDWCARHDLLVTGGSDCHGGFVGRELGVPMVRLSDLRLGDLVERVV